MAPPWLPAIARRRGRVASWRPRWLAAGAIAVVAAAIAIAVVYPWLGRRAVRARAIAALEARFGARPTLGAIDVELGRAVVRDVRVASARGTLTIDEVVIDVDTWASLLGRAQVDRVRVRGLHLETDRAGLSALRGARTRSSRGPAPRVILTDAVITVRDVPWFGAVDVAVETATIHGGDIALDNLAVVAPAHRLSATVSTVVATGPISRWRAAAITVAGVTLSDVTAVMIRGAADRIDLAAAARTADGSRWRATAVTAADHTFAAVIASAPPIATAPVALMTLTRAADRLTWAGDVALPALTLDEPAVASAPVALPAARIHSRGHLAQAARTVELPDVRIAVGAVELAVHGTLALPGGRDPDGRHRRDARIDLRIAIPPTPCRAVLAAMPAALVPALAGYQLDGTFRLALTAALDGADLDAATVSGVGGLDDCQIIAAPARSPTMLGGRFAVERHGQAVELRRGGPGYVRLGAIAPTLVASLIETEDPRFYAHHGIDGAALGRALIANVEAGRFAIGSSTITMQLARNLFLTGRKTLSRKLQEVFFAWHLEQVLTKPQILELYLNVIEFGPDLYGIGVATDHYFGKAPLELSTREAAFFSAIVPRPSSSYRSMCQRDLDPVTRDRLQRALTLLVTRGHVDRAEWRFATDDLLVFRELDTDPAACMARRDAALARLRSDPGGP